MIKRFAVFLTWTFFGITSLHSQKFINLDLPYDPDIYQEVEDKKDNNLQYFLEEELYKNPYWSRLIKQKKMAVSLVDLRNPYDLKYASVNGNHMMYAASLPKIAVLLTAMEYLENGMLEWSEDIHKDMRQMIAKSNNRATTRMIERLGFDAIAKTLTSPDYQLYDQQNGGGLWVGKKYAASGKRNPDPLKGLSHAATADQVARFYTMLAFGKLVDYEASKQMLEYMGNPELHHKFVNTIEKVAPYAQIYRKSGSWRNYHADSALVFSDDGRQYILVALIQDPSGGQICKDLVHSAEAALGVRDYVPAMAKKEVLQGQNSNLSKN